MSYLIEWDNAEKTVILQQYTDNAVKDDLYHLAKESATMLKNISHTVHLIIDERNVKMTLSSADIQYLADNVPQNQGAVVLVIDEAGLAYKKVMQDVGKTIAPKVFEQPHFASTLEEARQLLQEKCGVQYP